MGAVVDTLWKRSRPIFALHIGGGAFTLPRYIAATRPGSTNTVMEIDPAVVDTAEQDFGLRTNPSLRVEVGDARLLVPKEPVRSYDVVIGDAFSGLSVPWQLTTKEFLTEVQRLLRPRGAYLMNLIDTRLGFVKAEAATLMLMFRYVALFRAGGNNVLTASNAPIDLAPVVNRVFGGISAGLFRGQGLRRLIGGARVLEDDFAPVDQLLSR
jgi:spermidine synthase